jgi:hypothetical protein
MKIDCSKCPDNQECCGIMIFDSGFLEENITKIEDGFIQVIQKGNMIHYLYEDSRCCFLDRKTRLCKIYDKRPQVCKDYGYLEKLPCPFFKKSGNRRSPASQTKIERIIDKQISKTLNNLKTSI